MRNLPLLDMARELLIEKGVITRSEARMLTKHELVKRAVHGTSDFPKITSNAANKRLQQAYQVQPKTFMKVVNVVEVADFKQVSVAHLGGISALEEVGEHGEFHYATAGEKSETYVLSTWGKIVALSRQLIINDDLRAFANMTAKLGRAASVLENNLHWALRTGNKVMGDGLGVYHSTHANVGTKALGLDGLGIGFQTMLKQRDISPKAGELGDFINVVPAVLTVPPELMHLALQLTADITPGVVTAANPYRGKLTVEVEPRLSAAGVTNGTTTWFLDASPSDWPTWELAYLEGERGPVVESREGFEVDGVEIKVRHDVAMAPIDWVGTFRSDGTIA
jgi:phage major head subunit gpT-like protein